MDILRWYAFAARGAIGATGSEHGVILRDEEYRAGAHMTLERDGYTPFAITCGIYGWMMHTRFFATGQEADEAFAIMQVELARIVDLIPTQDGPDDPRASERASAAGEDIRAFIKKFP